MAKIKVWERIDGGISITRFNFSKMLPGETEEQFIERESVKLRKCDYLMGAVEKMADDSDLPPTKVDRNEWHFKDGKIKPDPVKVQAKADALVAKEAKKNAVLSKLKISKEDLEDLLK